MEACDARRKSVENAMAIMLSATNGPDALQGEAQESEYSMDEEQAGEQYKIAKADYEAFIEKYSIKKD